MTINSVTSSIIRMFTFVAKIGFGFAIWDALSPQCVFNTGRMRTIHSTRAHCTDYHIFLSDIWVKLFIITPLLQNNKNYRQ